MRVKKSDIFKIIQEELEAVKRALPAWLGEADTDPIEIIGSLANQHGFLDLREPLEQMGFDVDFVTSPMAMYMLKKGGAQFAVLNKKYAEDPDLVVGEIAIGRMNVEEGKARVSEEVEDDDVFFEQDYNAGFKGGAGGDERSEAYQLGQYDRENGLEHNPSEHPPRGPLAKVNEKQRDYSYGDEEDDNNPYAYKDPVENPKRSPGDATHDALVKLGEFLAKLENEGHSELANELDQVIVQMKNAGLNEAELQLEPGLQVKNIDTDQVGTVQSVKAGAGVVIKLEDGTIEEWETSSLEPVGGVEEVMIGDREVDDGPRWRPPLKPEFNAMSLEDKQDVLEKSKTYHRENRREWDPDEESQSGRYIGYMIDTIEKEEAAAVTEGGAVGDTGDPYKQGDPSVQDSWSTDELIEFLQKHPSGVTPKEMAMAFGGQWQAHAAKLQKLVTQGTLKKDVKTTMGKFKNRYVLADVNETLRDIFGFNELEEAPVSESEDDIYERMREKAMRQLEGHPQGKLPPAPDADIPQEDVERVISFLQDQRDAGVGELDLSSIMQDMGMELDIVKLIMVNRLGYEIEASESDPTRGKINFNQGVDTMNEAGIGNIEVGDHVDVMGSAIAGAAGEVIELTKTTQGDPALVVRLTKAASSKLYGGIGDEVIVKPDFVELSALPGDKRPQPGDDDQGEYAMHYTEEHEPGHEEEEDEDESLEARQAKHAADSKAFHKKRDMARKDKEMGSAPYHYQEAACNKLREHVGRFMKVTLREEARNK